MHGDLRVVVKCYARPGFGYLAQGRYNDIAHGSPGLSRTSLFHQEPCVPSPLLSLRIVYNQQVPRGSCNSSLPCPAPLVIRAVRPNTRHSSSGFIGIHGKPRAPFQIRVSNLRLCSIITSHLHHALLSRYLSLRSPRQRSRSANRCAGRWRTRRRHRSGSGS